MSVLVGERPLPEEYLEVLDSVNHIFIGPSSATFDEVHDVTVTDADGLTALPENRDKNIVLRLSRGDISHIPEIPDAELLRLDHAPLCRRCDAYACRRCVWLNRKLTRELNVPSHRQCVLAHIERNASLPDSPTSYLDPFEVYEK